MIAFSSSKNKSLPNNAKINFSVPGKVHLISRHPSPQRPLWINASGAAPKRGSSCEI